MAISQKFKVLLIIMGSILLITASIVIPVVLFRGSSIQGINIESDDDLKKYAKIGTGTSSDPYIIENYEIKPKEANSGIRIVSVTKNFMIRNCLIEKGGEQETFRGINIGSIGDGIAIITNNTITNSFYGIIISSSEGVTVNDNTISNCYSAGIYIIESPYALLDNNEITNINVNGIIIENSRNVDVNNNNLISTGISLDFDTGSDYSTLDFANNKVNGKDFGYLKSIAHQTISGELYGQLKMYDCINVIVENLEIHDTVSAVSMIYCDDCTIRDSILTENSAYSIGTWGCTNILLTNNTCSKNVSKRSWDDYPSVLGIILRFSDDVTVQNSRISQSWGDGLYLYGCDGCTIRYNKFYDNHDYGVFLWYSENNMIHHNTFIDNARYNSADSQAFDDDGTGNLFYDTGSSEGNYWDDWGGGYYYIESFYGLLNYDPFPLSSAPV